MKSFGNIAKDGQVRAVASGALTDGASVIINSDGTVSVVSGSDSSVGSETVFNAAQTATMSVHFDSNNNKIIVAYRDSSNSGYGTAKVGTVSGSSISFGTATVFNSDSSSWIESVFDTSNNKSVIAFRDSSAGKCIVGTVSGTSISFGSSATFSGTQNTSYVGMTFDSNSNKAVVVWTDDGGSSHGKAIVGTVSGTSISFGSAVTYNSVNPTTHNFATFDSNSNKVVVFFRDYVSSYTSKAIVGTVSGTSISFGSAVTYQSVSVEQGAATFDSSNNKVVVVYEDQNNGNLGVSKVGTVSGTSISFGSQVTFFNGNTYMRDVVFDTTNNEVVIAYMDFEVNKGAFVSGAVSGTSISYGSPTFFNPSRSDAINAAYDSNANKTVIIYGDYGASPAESATAIVAQAGSTNLTSENFIGFSDGVFANNDSAVINTTNTIDRNQSGLTAGQTYFVQVDGTLGLTAADPSVTAGTAISATELIVKG